MKVLKNENISFESLPFGSKFGSKFSLKLCLMRLYLNDAEASTDLFEYIRVKVNYIRRTIDIENFETVNLSKHSVSGELRSKSR